ncbi:MAG: response regulator, partial [Ruminococcus sp.]
MNKKIKVLIGDDSAENGVSIANKLRERGMYAYTRRRDVTVILDSIRNDPPDIAVLDVTAQNGDAVSIMKRARELGVNVPAFIITSAYDNEFVENQVMENGASRFMLKPYAAEDLCRAINSILGDKAD